MLSIQVLRYIKLIKRSIVGLHYIRNLQLNVSSRSYSLTLDLRRQHAPISSLTLVGLAALLGR